MERFIHIRASRFPVLPGEEEELVNEGMYGKALAENLQTRLREKGYEVPFICCEDWGWWVALKGFPFTFGVCIYACPEREGFTDYVCSDGAFAARKRQWRRFRFVETEPFVQALSADLKNIFEADEEVKIVGVGEEFPFEGCRREVQNP